MGGELSGNPAGSWPVLLCTALASFAATVLELSKCPALPLRFSCEHDA